MIKLKNISTPDEIRSKNIELFKDLNLTIKPGDRLIIRGESGSGKTTLLNIIGLIQFNYQGQYLLKDEDMKSKKNKELGRLRNSMFGYIFQDNKLMNSESILENIRLPLDFSKRSKKFKRDREEKILDFLKMEDRKNEKVQNLSGGEKQKVAIARALINEPTIIIADEAFSSIHPEEAKRILKYLEGYLTDDHIFIMTSHVESRVPSFINREFQL